MAAQAQATFRLWLRDDIGLQTDANATQMMASGFSSFAELQQLDTEDIKNLCRQLRKDDVNPVPVSFVAEKKLKSAVYAASLYDLVGRPLTRPLFNANRLRAFDSYEQVIDRIKDIDKPVTPVVSKKLTIDKALDSLPNVLRGILGVRKVPLSYVIRPEWPADANGNPIRPALAQLANNSIHSGEFSSFQEELIAFCPHEGPGWEEDNAAVFTIISDMLKDSSQASTLQGFKRARNGRGAYLTLCQHNLSNSTWDEICRRAEDTQTKKVWNGRNHRYTLKTHCDHHRDAFNDMVRAAEFSTYQVPDEHTRVSRLLASIQASHISEIAAAKTTIEATPAKRGNFELAADFLILMCPKQKTGNQLRNISMIQTSPLTDEEQSQMEDLHAQGVTLPNDRMYYDPSEYDGFTQEQKSLLYLMRKENGQIAKRGKQGRNQRGGPKSAKKLAKLLKKEKKNNKKLKRRVSALKQKQDTDENDENSSEEESEQEEKKGKKQKVRFNQRS